MDGSLSADGPSFGFPCSPSTSVSACSTSFFRRVLGLFEIGATDGATFAPARRLSSSVESVEGLIVPRVALAAISPILVIGIYAPPANLNPHFLQSQTPTLHRFTVLNLHCGHSCFERKPVTISLCCLRPTVPYRAPKPPPIPRRLAISLSPRRESLPGSPQPFARLSRQSSLARLP